MDELLIGEKKYVSSKQAAKVTGYAKDYIGQLCREGRVPARLVGRSWYVLESAIHDHRFGNPKDSFAEEVKPDPVTSAFHSTWESPRYEASDVETFPTVNQLRGSESFEPTKNESQEVAERLQETWQAWFDRFDHVSGVAAVAEKPVEAEKPTQEPETDDVDQHEVIHIPIHAVHHSKIQPTPQEYSADDLEVELPSREVEEKRRSGGVVRVIQLSGAMLAAAFILIATLGSGFLDAYILSSGPVSQIAGVAVYNK